MTAALITAASLAAGHDGLAEVAIDVTYSNGATRSMSLPLEAVVGALDAAAIADLDDLVGRPWSVLVPPPAAGTTTASTTSAPTTTSPHSSQGV